jgi:hypothetical protein
VPSHRVGTSIKLKRCAGCLNGFTKTHQPELQCVFGEKGFPLDPQIWALPCGSKYHMGCFHAGPPFVTRLKDNKGLRCPKDAEAALFPNFVCEACQVRATLQRELTLDRKDIHLLQLERMRILDTMNRLAAGSHKVYKYPIRRVQKFEVDYGVRILRPTPLLAPSPSACIPLMWAQLDHTLQPGKQEGSRVKFGSARQTRSAVSSYYQWDLAVSRPEQAMTTGKGDKSLITPYVVPTDEISYTHFSTGLKKRMGDSAKKSTALRFPHIVFLNEQFELSFQAATNSDARHEAAAAGTANLLFWLGWLRSNEGFSLTREDIEVTPPMQGPKKGLPPGVGVIEIRLLPETKTSTAAIADIIVAYTCWSGLSLGKWLDRLLPFTPADGQSLFSTASERHWTSAYYRKQHVYRHLAILRAMGDPSMAIFSDTPGHRLADLLYSMHSWRRGADTFVQQFNASWQRRKARIDEVYEHGRWTKKGTAEAMHIHYREWGIPERLALTQLCM